MNQERIYLTLKKDAGGQAVVVDQHGRILDGVLSVSLEQSMSNLNTISLKVSERTDRGRGIVGRNVHASQGD